MWQTWCQRRAERWTLAQAAVEGDGGAAARLLHGWSWADRPATVAGLAGSLVPTDTPIARRIQSWVGEPPGPAVQGASEAELDRQVLARSRSDQALDTAGALVWLARIGEEVRRREDRAGRVRSYAPAAEDAAVADLWRELLLGDFGPGAPRRFVRLFAPAVRRAFAGVCGALRLPRQVTDHHVEQALAAADGLAWGAPGDLAARVLETTGEPLAALAPVLAEDGLGRVEGCVARRRLWRGLQPLLGEAISPENLAVGGDLVVAHRLLAALEAGSVREHTLGLPGWGVVQANRSRMRGRLRAVLADHPRALCGAVTRLDALTARTDDAVRRHAWAWAWREARTGFGFDPGRLRAPPCPPLPVDVPELAPLGPADEPALVTLLLALRGRGQWEALESWLAGVPGRELGATFYRHLGEAPSGLVDPGTSQRTNRGYVRLREHLQDGGLEAYLPILQGVAARIAGLPRGRGLRQRLAEALEPEWQPALVPLPRRGVEAFCDNLQGLLNTN